ncbi:MAG: hypothetical protein QXX38_03050 [Candidatus Aenigmatarchaeota archaeon]
MAFDLKKIFRKKEEVSVPLAPEALTPPKPITAEETTAESMKAKIDLLLAQLESLNVRYETVNQRLANLERMIQEIYVIAKRS